MTAPSTLTITLPVRRSLLIAVSAPAAGLAFAWFVMAAWGAGGGRLLDAPLVTLTILAGTALVASLSTSDRTRWLACAAAAAPRVGLLVGVAPLYQAFAHLLDGNVEGHHHLALSLGAVVWGLVLGTLVLGPLASRAAEAHTAKP